MTTEKKLTLGSLFDGSGGFPLGGILCGITPLWASEVEPFPIRVTSKRMPEMKHLGDVSKLCGGTVPPVDIITFGSPCQDMSIAGKRAGLDGSRSNLFFEAVRIIKEMREATNGQYPRYCVWENVPGAFSSNKGADFKAVLDALIGIVEEGAEVPMPEKGQWPKADLYMGDGWSLAYRTLDAQYWGVPQRRKRIYLVADFAGGCAGKILFESEGVSGYPAKGFFPWEGTAAGAEAGSGATGFDLVQITSKTNRSRGADEQSYTLARGSQPVVVLNDQGGSQMGVSEDVAGTLRAQEHGHQPLVMAFAQNQRNEVRDLGGKAGAVMAEPGMKQQTFLCSAGFCTEHSSKARSIGYEEERSPTLRAGTVPAAMEVYENHGADTRCTGPLDTSPTVTARYGTGGNNQPLVATPKTLKIRSGCEGGGKGALVQEDKSATLGTHNDQTLFAPKVYGVCAKDSHAMRSDNPKSGFYEAQTTRTLDQSGGNPSCNQGGMVVVDPAYCMTMGCYPQVAKEQCPTLMARDYKDPNIVSRPSYGLGRDVLQQSGSSHFGPTVNEELQPPLMAKGPSAVIPAGVEYTVRRLTPTECARLQGFPDWWCWGLDTADPSEEDIAFWAGVFETYRQITGSAAKPKSRNQVVKWLKHPHSDAAEYKMWGNGVALPCVCFVLAGIVWSTQGGGQ